MKTPEQNSNEIDELTERIEDIERTIGDMAAVFDALKMALHIIPLPPTCPPYCGHADDDGGDDEVPLEERVKDIRKYVGDYGQVLDSLKEALDNMAQPTCPPYCAHEVSEEGC